MNDVLIRTEGHAGRITLQRPKALNALTPGMLRQIKAALGAWAVDDAVRLVIFDAEGDKAFCAGGDIAEFHAAGRAGNFEFGRRFWRDEYRLNALIAEYSKPAIAFMQGYTMGGGVGIGCHCSVRVVGETSQVAMPECGIGLVPDVGGSLLLATAPGRLGEFLGLTGARMGPGDAIHAGFADIHLPESAWKDAIALLCETGKPDVDKATPPAAVLPAREIEAAFEKDRLPEILAMLDAASTETAARAAKALRGNSPLSMAATLELISRVRKTPTIRHALAQEYRFTSRAAEEGDFLEGIRAAIIDKDRKPQWRHALDGVTAADADRMLAPLGAGELTWEDSS